MGGRRWISIVLAIPFVAYLWPPFYAALQPEWQGIPYFIWYQFLWVIISAALTVGVYWVQSRGESQ
jgi:hypothetical protein